MISVLLNFILDKIPVTTLQTCFSQDKSFEPVISSVIHMVLSALSVIDFQKSHGSSRRSSPAHSPYPSIHDGHSLMAPVERYERFSPESPGSPRDVAWKYSMASFAAYVKSLWHSNYQELFMDAVRQTVQDADWPKLTQIYQNLAFNIEESICSKIVPGTLPIIFERLVSSLPPPEPSITRMLCRLSMHCRPDFYKHVVTCTASDDEHKIAKQLTLMLTLRKYMSGVQFWMHDAEMMNVLLLSDVGAKRDKESIKTKEAATADVKWGSTTLGQCVVAYEFMFAIKELRDLQRESSRNMEEDEVAKKFLIDFERRLSVFLTAKEKTSLMPLPLRVILCNLFLQIRFFCNTTHRPGWLSRAIDWATQAVATSELYLDMEVNADNKKAAHESAILNETYLDDVSLIFQRLRVVYAMAIDKLEPDSEDVFDYHDRPVSNLPAPRINQSNESNRLVSPKNGLEFPSHIKRNEYTASLFPVTPGTAATLNLGPAPLSSQAQPLKAVTIAQRRLDDMSAVNQDPFGAVFSLLVAVFNTLTAQEFNMLIRPLWEKFIDNSNPRAFVPAAFLFMQCAEKVPKAVIEAFMHDLYRYIYKEISIFMSRQWLINRDCFDSDNALRRYSTVEKQLTLAGYRFNILAQEYISVSARKRPFRGDGGAFSTSFVPTDLGSDQYTMDEPRWMVKLKNASNFPIELKRQIQELGWDDDQEGEEHEALKKVLTPLALLPSRYLEDDENENRNDGNDNTLLHRKNDGEQRQSGSVSKIIARRKRLATVHALTIVNLSMVDLLDDDFGGVASVLRELLESFLRDDPALFLRPFLGDLDKTNLDRHRELLTRLNALVTLRHKLPPAFAYILFNYLAGMLKWLARENNRDGLMLMTLIHPILAQLVFSTNELSTRDMRKNKIEHLLVSTGRFWFTYEQPVSMFPRYLEDARTPFAKMDIPWDIFGVAMLRISHVQFLTNFLLRYPREVYAVKKNLQDYEPIPVPGSEAYNQTSADLFFPNIALRKRNDTGFAFEEKEDCPEPTEIKCVPPTTQQYDDIRSLSALRARVWLRFVDTLLGGLNKNFNDRLELEGILKGVNNIIMEHNMDFGIIGQALVLYTRMVARFKRLFVSNRGYGIFLPALFKVFCEVERLSHVRSAIVFAWCRFYAVHEESFVFQMLGTLVPLILNAYNKSVSLGGWMTDNLFHLMQAMNNPPRLGATSDVLGLQLQVELDDHDRSIQERIDAASNPMAMPLSTTILRPLTKSVTAPITTPLVVTDYTNRPFYLQNFIKLFLTIIAYDPGSLRAEQFIKVLRHMLPRFCILGNLNHLVSEGIFALIDVFLKFSKTAKPMLGTSGNQATTGAPHININIHHLFDDRNFDNIRPADHQQAYGKQWQQNDRLSIKREFVLLVNQYFKCQGTLNEANQEKMAQIIRIIMRDYSSIRGMLCPTDWIKEYLITSVESMIDMRNCTKSVKTLLVQIHNQYRSQWKTVDACDLYEGLSIVLERSQGKTFSVHEIAGIIREHFVPLGLNIAMRPFDLDQQLGREKHDKFCNALVRLIVAILENSTQDVLQDIENQAPSIPLFVKIIIPICLQYDLRWDYSSISLMRKYRPEPTANWMRLTAYISKSCSPAGLFYRSKSNGFSLSALASNMTPNEGSNAGAGAATSSAVAGVTASDVEAVPENTRDRKNSHSPASIAQLFALGMVSMKIILIRGSKSFDKVKGAWVQIAYFLKGALLFGQSLKTLKNPSSSGRSTPYMPASPSLAPPTGWPGTPVTPESGHQYFQPSPSSSSNSIHTLYDYATWSFLEFIVCYKTPILLFLRDFIYDRLRETGIHDRRSLRYPGGWKSWGSGGDTLKDHLQQPQRSPTCGLGFNLSTRPPPPPSPSISINAPSDWSASEGVLSPKPTDTLQQQQQQQSRPASQVSSDLYAESLKSIQNVQALFGQSGWNPDQQLRWTFREAVKRVSNEWRTLSRLHLDS